MALILCIVLLGATQALNNRTGPLDSLSARVSSSKCTVKYSLCLDKMHANRINTLSSSYAGVMFESAQV